ncbi:MAG: hypothetical protein KJO45_04820 [Sulfurovum sp.]|nr:hypothetical protein [Sulfurovum sp.]
MELPAITLPKVELPFDIPVLLHPAVDHFAIALPVVILLLELMNLVLRKKAISGVSFFLILLTVVVSVGAYFTGLVDGKEAYPALTEAGKAALSEHKILGTYLMLASGVILLFKLLSMLTGKGIIKGLYLLILIAFVAGIFEQGKEGGELVYKYGMNVEQVKTLDDKIFDLEEALEESADKTEAVKEESTPITTETPTPVVVPAETAPVVTPMETTPIEAIKETVSESVKTIVEEEVLKVEGMPEEMVQPQIATH